MGYKIKNDTKTVEEEINSKLEEMGIEIIFEDSEKDEK